MKGTGAGSPAAGPDGIIPVNQIQAKTVPPRQFGMFPSLRQHPRFRYLWTSSFFFFAGIWMQTTVLGWLVYNITNSEFLLAVFTAARLGPMMLGPISGVVADRFHRGRFMLVTVAWAFIVIAVLAVLDSTGHINFWELIVGGFLLGLAQSPSQPARYTMVSELVPRAHLSNANALNSMALNMTQMIGPAIGGVAVGLFGVSTALWITAVWYPLSFIALWPIRDVGEAVHRQAGDSAVAQLVEGLHVILADRMMASVLFVSVIANIFLWPVYQAFMPVFAKGVLHLGPDGLGWLLAFSGVGALIGSLAIAFLGDFRGKGAMFVYGTAVWGACWTLFALSRSVPLSFVLIFAVGVSSAAFGVLQSTLLLILAPANVRGRAMGLQELAIGVLPVATLLHGAIADFMGVPMSTAVSGLLLVLLMLVLAVKVPGLRNYHGTEQAEPDTQAR